MVHKSCPTIRLNKNMNIEQRKFKKVVKSRKRHAGKVTMAKEQVVARKNKILGKKK